MTMNDAAPRVNARANAAFALNKGGGTGIAVPESFAMAAAKEGARQLAIALLRRQ
ncbi:MAG: hypothetical protein AAF982_08985 [Pseudomonadota bacterium]